MPRVLDWEGTSADGLPLTRSEFVGTANLPLGFMRDMRVKTDHPGASLVKVICSPEHDETIRVFTRRTAMVGMNGSSGQSGGGTVVVELANAVTPGRFVRLYIKDNGLILSSEEVHG